MNDMSKSYTPNNIVNEIMMERMSHEGAFLLVEGSCHNPHPKQAFSISKILLFEME